MDYLPAELEFLHFLLQDELAAQAEARAAEFRERFMAPWVPEFCRKGREITEDRFWLGVFAELKRFLK